MVCERDTLWSLNGTLSSNQIKSYYISNFHIYNLLPSTPITSHTTFRQVLEGKDAAYTMDGFNRLFMETKVAKFKFILWL